MEVHHHPEVEKKGFKEYLLEGLMIFIAVMLGFFAENIRERISDNATEKEYMVSMVADLKADTAAISRTKNVFIEISMSIDTMLTCLKADNPNPSVINHILSGAFWQYEGYSYNNETIEQLKNSGNFRLIRNKAVVDSVLKYDNYMNSFLLSQYNDLNNTLFSYKEAEAKVLPYSELKINYDTLFNSSDFKNVSEHTFITHNKEAIAFYYNKLFIHDELCHTFISSLNGSQEKAVRLINFINKEYHFKDK